MVVHGGVVWGGSMTGWGWGWLVMVGHDGVVWG